MSHYWRPYVPVAKRRQNAERELKRGGKSAAGLSPVVIKGKSIATTPWGKAWCANLERYSDYSNRLPRGRTYVRNGSVVDLSISEGQVNARVAGSRLYTTQLQVAPLARARWKALVAACGGAIDSLVELLQGRFDAGVMERMCERERGMFPAPSELRFSCSCPDWAAMCKHVAAVMYGVGARLDVAPELLFLLRGVDAKDLLSHAGTALAPSGRVKRPARRLESDALGEMFGIEIASEAPAPRKRKTSSVSKSARAKKR
jgi:uncharacterized Zn finger protein